MSEAESFSSPLPEVHSMELLNSDIRKLLKIKRTAQGSYSTGPPVFRFDNDVYLRYPDSTDARMTPKTHSYYTIEQGDNSWQFFDRDGDAVLNAVKLALGLERGMPHTEVFPCKSCGAQTDRKELRRLDVGLQGLGHFCPPCFEKGERTEWEYELLRQRIERQIQLLMEERKGQESFSADEQGKKTKDEKICKYTPDDPFRCNCGDCIEYYRHLDEMEYLRLGADIATLTQAKKEVMAHYGDEGWEDEEYEEAIERRLDGYCIECSDTQHESCGMVSRDEGCSCCDNTKDSLSEHGMDAESESLSSESPSARRFTTSGSWPGVFGGGGDIGVDRVRWKYRDARGSVRFFAEKWGVDLKALSEDAKKRLDEYWGNEVPSGVALSLLIEDFDLDAPHKYEMPNEDTWKKEVRETMKGKYWNRSEGVKRAESFEAQAPRGHKMMTKELGKKIPPLYSQDGKGDEAIVYAHYFNPYGVGEWWILEWDGENEMFGYADLGFPELGYISLSELENVSIGGMELPIERDLHWQEKTLGEVKEAMSKYRAKPKALSSESGKSNSMWDKSGSLKPLLAFVGFGVIGGLIGWATKETMGIWGAEEKQAINPTDPFQQAEFDSFSPMPHASKVIDAIMLRERTNAALVDRYIRTAGVPGIEVFDFPMLMRRQG